MSIKHFPIKKYSGNHQPRVPGEVVLSLPLMGSLRHVNCAEKKYPLMLIRMVSYPALDL